MEMGVSISDLGKQSTIFGQKRSKSIQINMKMSEFKENKSCFKPRLKTEEVKGRLSTGTGKRKKV